MSSASLKFLHTNARCPNYPRSSKKRFPVPDEFVPWSVPFPDYLPQQFTSPSVLHSRIADDADPSKISFNQYDQKDKIDRTSSEGEYEIRDKVPLNPFGRTGLCGRGKLYRWGPGHAADPIVTRWERDENGAVVKKDDRPVLEFVGILRRDGGGWALPGGMVEPGDDAEITLKKEFGEEAMNYLEKSPEERKEIGDLLDKLFSNGKLIYKGYVDDPRNTDNAWLETTAVNFHDDDGTGLAAVSLTAGDDAGDIQWMKLSAELNVYANHKHFLKSVAELLHAYW